MRRFGWLLLLGFCVAMTPGRGQAASCLDDSDCRVLDQGGGACGGVLGYCLYPASYECATRVVEPQAEGTPCPDDGDACTADLCDAAGRCAHVPIEGCQPPPDCAIDADCAYMNESSGCSTTKGTCSSGRCTPVTTPLCTAPGGTGGSGGGGGGCAIAAAPARSSWPIPALLLAFCLFALRRSRAA